MGSERSLPLWIASNRDRFSQTRAAIEDEVLSLFTQFRSPLLRYFGAMGLRVQDGEEIVQEVFLALFQHLEHGKPRTNLRGWIFTTGHHLALKRRMRNDRLARLHCAEEAATDQTDPAPGPAEHLEFAERRRRLTAVVRVLPETDRCCLYLRAEGLRYRDIAQTLGISLGAVALAIARSLARVQSVDER